MLERSSRKNTVNLQSDSEHKRSRVLLLKRESLCDMELPHASRRAAERVCVSVFRSDVRLARVQKSIGCFSEAPRTRTLADFIGIVADFARLVFKTAVRRHRCHH